MQFNLLIIAIILGSVSSFTIAENLKDAGSSVTPDMLAKIKDTCDIAYSFFRTDKLANAKYISDGLKTQGLPPNWDVIITQVYSDLPGFSNHSTTQSWWASLKKGQIAVNDFSYYMAKNVPNGSVVVSLSNKNASGTGIKNQTLPTIQNILSTSFDENFKTDYERASYIQKRVQLFLGGKWSVFLTNNSPWSGYIYVIGDSWLTIDTVLQGSYRRFLLYKVSN